MKKLTMTALSAMALSLGTTAQAGAVGTLITAGLHQERAYYYSASNEQSQDNQMRFNGGIGFEALVGDKDEKIQGILRFLWLSDAPPKNPDTADTLRPESPNYDDLSNKNTGVLGLGVQWGLLGDPSDKQLILTSLVGSGFITKDNTEYMLLEVGAGGTYNLSETIQANANIALTMRNRKHISFGPNLYMGVRYLFD
jgi:hypothetical protein